MPITDRQLKLGEISFEKFGLSVKASEAIAKGDLVYIDGWDENAKLYKVSRADADVAERAASYIAEVAIASGAIGKVLKRLRRTGLNTSGSTVGNAVYLSASVGGWTLTAPGADGGKQTVGRVAVVSATAGVVEFDLSPGNQPRALGTGDLQDPFELTKTYSGTGSYQRFAVDLKLAAGAGAAGKKLAPFMGNLVDNVNHTTNSIIAGIIGAYSLVAKSTTTYPEGAVLAQVSDLVDDGHVNCFVAYIDGDSGKTFCNAAFKVMSNNSTATSGMDYGVDLEDAAHDGYIAVDRAFYKKAPFRMPVDFVLLTGAGAPTNGTTGANVAGIGSLYSDQTNGKLYINTGTKASPTWTVVGTQT